MSYQEIMSMPYGDYVGMLESISILQAQEQMAAFNASIYGSEMLKSSARDKMKREVTKRADPSRFTDENKNQVSTREIGLILGRKLDGR
jgi:hypothetical protein